jgi:guanylate kinase
MIIIGFSGRARTGKSTLSRYLYDAAHDAGWDVQILPFAGPLKRHVIEDMGYAKEKDPVNYRRFCQEIGASKRAENPDHWVNLWYKGLLQAYEAEHNETDRPVLYLVDDVRYPNELKKLNEIGAITCFIKHNDREIEEPDGEWRTHNSEEMANLGERSSTEVLKSLGYDYVVHNDKDEKEIAKWCKRFVQEVMITAEKDLCPCEGCQAARENRPVDNDKVNQELDDLLKDIEKDLEDDDGEANDSNT